MQSLHPYKTNEIYSPTTYTKSVFCVCFLVMWSIELVPIREHRLYIVMTRAAVGGYSDSMLPPMFLAIFYKLHL